MEKIEFLYKLASGKKNDRYLMKIDGNYYSAFVSKDFGTETEIKIEEAKQHWIKRYENYLKGKPRENIIEHLIEYKKRNANLASEEFGEWSGKKYEHILPNEKLNLLNNGYKEELEETYTKLKTEKPSGIHRAFAHLNSSQAFALNFFVPVIQENLFDKFLDTATKELKIEGTVKNYQFEKQEYEDTQFDFYLEAGDEKFTFEVKYSEQPFGDTDSDEEHIKKYDEIYVQKLEKVLASFDKEKFREQFFDEYQLWCNICFADENTNVCFVFPKFRKDLQEAVDEAKKLCKSEIQEKIHCIFVDDFVEKMKKSENEKLKNHYTEFYKKYLNIKK